MQDLTVLAPGRRPPAALAVTLLPGSVQKLALLTTAVSDCYFSALGRPELAGPYGAWSLLLLVYFPN